MGEEQEIEYKESFDSGKYTAIFYKKGGLTALRYGEPWRDLAGDNLFYWMLVEVARLREENRQLKGGPFVALSFEEAIAILTPSNNKTKNEVVDKILSFINDKE